MQTLLQDFFPLWVAFLALLQDFLLPLAGLLGLLVGSFLNVVIYRLPIMMEREWALFAKEHLKLAISPEERKQFNLSCPASHCPKCGASIKPWQNIPIVSYLLQRGRCAKCHTAISMRYPAIELLTAVLFAVVAWRYGATWFVLGGWVFTAFLLALTLIDADTQYLPDQLTLPLIWLGLLFNLADGLASLSSAVLGAVIGYVSLWLLVWLYRFVTGKVAMGGGDFKLLAALGAWLGVGMLPLIVFAASLIGMVMAIILRVGKGQYFAFGPSLAIAGWLVFVWYDAVEQGLAWWLSASGF